MLVWAHQCHLLGGKRLPGEFVNVSHRLLLLVKSKPGSGGLWAGARACWRLQLSGRGELSPATLPFGRSGSAWLVEIKSDSEAARGKSTEPRSDSRGEAGQDGFVFPAEGEPKGTRKLRIGMSAAPAKPNPLLCGVLSPRTRSMKL